MSPTQSIIFRDIDPKDREDIETILREHGVAPIEEVAPTARLSMACPALPLCGLAQGEAERIMPSYIERVRSLLTKLDMDGEEILMRMTGCPNGCARPYMAELSFVGDGPKTYQIWVGGSPVLQGRTGFALKDRVKQDSWEDTLEPLLVAFKEERLGPAEFFGDYCHRVGKDALLAKLA